MKKLAIIFVVAVLVPSVALAWLAFRSLRDQQFILERQQSLLYEGVADSVSRNVQAKLLEEEGRFVASVQSLLREDSATRLSQVFDTRLRSDWSLAKIGFVVTLRGDLLSPSPASSSEAKMFYADNGSFLANRSPEEVYLNSFNVQNTASLAQNSKVSQKERNVVPQNQGQQQAANLQTGNEFLNFSKFTPMETEFRQLVGEASQGIVSRFQGNQLNLLVWHRPLQSSNLIFGAQIDLDRLTEELRPLIRSEAPFDKEICVALLNDAAKPVALSQSGFSANWKRPFAAIEVSETLPHWEIATYLLNPDALSQTAATARLTLGLLILILLTTIGTGGWIIVVDIKRQMALARQKTDFVSNVSHELKTPLTSIRMFSELLAEGRVSDPDKQRSYLNIISVEAARLTRLINNVLDFARMERGEKKYHFEKCDLTEVVREMCATFRPQLEENGFAFRCCLPSAPVHVSADRDALAQVIVNLLSNAEKFSSQRKDIELKIEVAEGSMSQVQLIVSDRGSGIPSGYEEKIFEQFFRAHDALNSSTQGSGLGLTLARQIARAHHGDLFYRSREGGGSCFIFQLPTA